MRLISLLTAVAAPVCLMACNRAADSALPPHHDFAGVPGRYTSVGTYTPSNAWRRLALGAKTSSPNAATPDDDQAIIVVQDSRTGEIRACGDLTARCIGFNPWRKTVQDVDQKPLILTPSSPAAPPSAGPP
jgi:hypothetical protein